jgi:hypothetical protein
MERGLGDAIESTAFRKINLLIPPFPKNAISISPVKFPEGRTKSCPRALPPAGLHPLFQERSNDFSIK